MISVRARGPADLHVPLLAGRISLGPALIDAGTLITETSAVCGRRLPQNPLEEQYRLRADSHVQRPPCIALFSERAPAARRRDTESFARPALRTVGRRQYEAAYPGCNWLNGDLDGDADVDFDDIAGFTSILSSGNSAGPAITYVWDAENRLTEVRPTFPAVTAGAKKVVFAYDYMNRRVRKRVYNWNSGGGSGAWETTPCLDRRFVYDGWLLLLELDGLSTPTPNAIVRKYTWGLDLSGLNGNPSASGLRAAGGIGGLLAVEQLALPAQCGQTALSAKSYWYFCDANGNVGQLIDGADDSGLTPPQAWAASRLAAKYEYDPYGNVTAQSGTYAEANLIRFTTNQHDIEFGLVYGKARYYVPNWGRWIGRDPISESDGPNVFAYVSNEPLASFDAIGLHKTLTGCCGPDISKPLTQTLSAAQRYFFSLTDKQRCSLCFSIWRDPLLSQTREGWDIYELHEAGLADGLASDRSLQNASCGTGTCAGTVRAFGICSRAGEVNYALWGKLNNLCNATYEAWTVQEVRTRGGWYRTTICGESYEVGGMLDGPWSLDDALLAIMIHRAIPRAGANASGPGNVVCRQIWTKYGWNNDPSELHYCTAFGCKTGCCGSYPHNFTTYLGGDHIIH